MTRPRRTYPFTLSSSSEGTQGGNGRLRRYISRVCADFSGRHYLAGRGNAGQDATAVEALLGHRFAQITGADAREGRHSFGAEGGLHGAYFRLSQ